MSAETTPEQHDAEAQRLRAEAAASFERCDTDGFLSQWATGISAQEHALAAEILRNGGQYEYWGLYQGDRRLAAKMIDGQFGPVWLLREDEAATFGRKFIPVVLDKASRVQKKLGLTERREMAPSRAAIHGRGHGLSGSAWAAAERTGDPWGLDSSLSQVKP